MQVFNHIVREKQPREIENLRMTADRGKSVDLVTPSSEMSDDTLAMIADREAGNHDNETNGVTMTVVTILRAKSYISTSPICVSIDFLVRNETTFKRSFKFHYSDNETREKRIPKIEKVITLEVIRRIEINLCIIRSYFSRNGWSVARDTL